MHQLLSKRTTECRYNEGHAKGWMKTQKKWREEKTEAEISSPAPQPGGPNSITHATAPTTGTASWPAEAVANLEAAILHPVPVLDLERHPPAAHHCLEASHHLRLLQWVDEDACGWERASRQTLTQTLP